MGPDTNGVSTLRPRRLRVVLATTLLALTAALGAASLKASPASAQSTPSLPSAPFTAPTCAGTTAYDPSTPAAPHTNLLVVDGVDLDHFNDGEPVVLYDSWGLANSTGFPPLCVVRFVPGQGPVSDWTFCTDYESKVCAERDPAGGLKEGSDSVGPQREIANNNRLNDDQRAAVAALLRRPQLGFVGTGLHYYNGATIARSDGTTDERNALQSLVWCITDLAYMQAYSGGTETCADNMPPSLVDTLISEALPEPVLAITSTSTTSATSYVISTNLHHQTLQVAIPPGQALSVCGGTATLVGSTLNITGDGRTVTTTELCGQAVSSATTVSITASNVDTSRLFYSVSEHPTIDCQVYANPQFNRIAELSASATASQPTTTTSTTASSAPSTTAPGSPDPTSSTTPGDTAQRDSSWSSSPNSLAHTGSQPLAWLGAGASLGAAGALLLSAQRRAHRP